MIIDVISGEELFSRWKSDRDGVFYPDPEFKKLMTMFLDPSEENLQKYNKKRIRRYELRVCSLRRKKMGKDEKWICDPDMVQGALDLLINSTFKSQRNYFE